MPARPVGMPTGRAGGLVVCRPRSDLEHEEDADADEHGRGGHYANEAVHLGEGGGGTGMRTPLGKRPGIRMRPEAAQR